MGGVGSLAMGEPPSFPDRQVVLITGMSRGLGERLATEFWKKGVDLFGTARDQQALEAVAKRLAVAPVRPGQRIAVVSADLADAAAPEFIVRQCWDQLGGLDVLVSNAAVQGPIGQFWEQDMARLEDALAIDLTASLRLAHAAIPFMMRGAKKRRSILFLSGGGATGPRPRFGVYAAAKAGLVRFAETLAVELNDFAISVNCIAPGAMATDMLAEVVAAGVNLAGAGEIAAVGRAKEAGEGAMARAAQLAVFLSTKGLGITGKLIAAQWDRWEDWPLHLEELNASDVYTLRRITGRDRNKEWGDR
jgi:NAD(P)-dependent dehydrogenase (short-subunit alcohol dehydrogenase family)